LDSGVSRWGQHSLGRFRLSVTNEADALARTQFWKDLRDSGGVNLNVALAKAHFQQGHINDSVASFTAALDLAADRAAKAGILAEAADAAARSRILEERSQFDGLLPAIQVFKNDWKNAAD